MKILVVASDLPWPQIQGGHLRLVTAIETLASLGETDLFAFRDYRRPEATVPATVPVKRLKTVVHRENPHQFRWRMAWLTRRGIPLEVAMHRMDDGPRLEFEGWVSEEYDLVWFDRAATYEWLGRPVLGPTIIDLHDLEDVKAQSRAQIIREGLSQQKKGAASARQAMTIAQVRLNGRDWRQFQRSVARDVDRVLLCSDVDAARSGIPNVVIVPNTYQRPHRAVGHADVRQPPVILFQATFDYAPNVDAAQWFVAEVVPRLRTHVPDIEVRLVGTTVPGVQVHHRPPAITVVGAVPAMEPELAQADIAVVPIRYGSGTRLKILESFAHRVPVVSTSIGAEGLEVADGVHLLLADEPEAFAAACERLLTEPDLRRRLVDKAEELYRDRYERSTARDRIEAVVREVAGTGGRQR
jgi:glycosyltransferase involved in cell wall biosynthesis